MGRPYQDGLRRLRRGEPIELVCGEAGLRNSAGDVAQNALDGLEKAIRLLLKGEREAGQIPLGSCQIVTVPTHEKDGRAEDCSSCGEEAKRKDQIR
ncbi:hypothetical protein [Microvirga sp. M2]|uniref:hypothetical protein n=1 Tax=Microvirga sp. M2 TaxID=3073270 RepID=UPI0039C41161